MAEFQISCAPVYEAEQARAMIRDLLKVLVRPDSIKLTIYGEPVSVAAWMELEEDGSPAK